MPELPSIGSVRTAAISSPWASNASWIASKSLNGTGRVCSANSSGMPFVLGPWSSTVPSTSVDSWAPW